jgi:hypothetical protein
VEDPEEYARLNAVGDAATSDAIEEALADDGGSCGSTARAAALDFAAALVAAKGPVDPPDHHPTKKHKKDNEDGEGKAPPATPGESALKDVVDAILAEAPKEKIEKVGKSAAAAGAVAVYAAPTAENALGVSRYFGLFQLTAALAAAGASRGRPMKDSAMKQFCQRHAFPAAAAARSPHVAAAAAKFIADAAARSKSPPLLRECVAALIAGARTRMETKRRRRRRRIHRRGRHRGGQGDRVVGGQVRPRRLARVGGCLWRIGRRRCGRVLRSPARRRGGVAGDVGARAEGTGRDGGGCVRCDATECRGGTGASDRLRVRSFRDGG